MVKRRKELPGAEVLFDEESQSTSSVTTKNISSVTKEQLEKTSIYLPVDLADSLDDLAYRLRKEHRVKVSRSRMMIMFLRDAIEDEEHALQKIMMHSSEE